MSAAFFKHTATGFQVVNNRGQAVLRSHNLDAHDWLDNFRVSVPNPLAHSHARGYLEGQRRGIRIVGRSIDKENSHTYDRETLQGTSSGAAAYALFHCLNEVLGQNAARTDAQKCVAIVLWGRLQQELDARKLSNTLSLLFVGVLDFCLSRYPFAIRYLWRANRDCDIVDTLNKFEELRELSLVDCA